MVQTDVKNLGGRPSNTADQDSYATCPEKDRLFCALMDEMVECSSEQPFGCLGCKVSEQCSLWCDKIGVRRFTQDIYSRRREEFLKIRDGKNGHNGNGAKH